MYLFIIDVIIIDMDTLHAMFSPGHQPNLCLYMYLTIPSDYSPGLLTAATILTTIYLRDT